MCIVVVIAIVLVMVIVIVRIIVKVIVAVEELKLLSAAWITSTFVEPTAEILAVDELIIVAILVFEILNVKAPVLNEVAEKSKFGSP